MRLLGCTLFGIHKHGASQVRSRSMRPGLDHVGLGCASRAELEQWEVRLNSLGIARGGVGRCVSYGSGLSFQDGDNIALECFAAPG